MAKKRTNVIPIIEDARHPAKYRMFVGMIMRFFFSVSLLIKKSSVNLDFGSHGVWRDYKWMILSSYGK